MSGHPPAGPAQLDLLVVGAGFAGLYMLHKARQQGLEALVVDTACGVGGTWHHNRYPGARVDIQSLEYSYGFDDGLQQDWHWTQRYAGQAELLAYAEHVADRFALRDGIKLGHRLKAAHFDEAVGRWTAEVVSDAGSQAYSAQFLVLATGPLSTPNRPPFEGLENFAGQVLHTAAWPAQPVDLRGQRVGVVGTGSSGVQLVTAIAPQVASLTVFQRTAAYAVPAHNGPLDAALEAQVKSNYAGFRQRNLRMRGGFGCDTMAAKPVSALTQDAAQRDQLFEAGWQQGGFAFLGAFNDLLTSEAANALAAEFVRGKIRQTVRDPGTAELLCPQHLIGCKRLCVDTGYYASFNLPHVHLVDVRRQPIAEVTATGVRVAGDVSAGLAPAHHALDTLVLATGFDAMTGSLMRIDLRGRGGQTIQQKWAGGPLNYLGVAIAGFPNLFTIAGPGSTSAFTNGLRSIEHHVEWISDCLAHVRRNGLSSIEASPSAEAQWVAHVNDVAKSTVYLGCNSWYLGANIAGKPRVFMPLAAGFPAYVKQCAEVAQQGYSGFALA